MRRAKLFSLVCLCVCLVMAVSMLAGCQQTPATTAPTTTPTPTAPGETTATPPVEEWKPTRDMSILIGFPAGGGMDIMSRLLIPGLQEVYGVNVIPNNMSGANSGVSAEYLMKEAADGYLIWAFSAGAVTFPATGVSPYYYKDIQMLAIVQGCFPTVSVPIDSPIKDMGDLITLLKEGGTTCSNSGIGGIWHVPQIMVVEAVNGSTNYVPYNGGKETVMAAAQGEVDWCISDLSEARTFINDKMLRPLAVYAHEPQELEGYGVIPSILDWIPELEEAISASNGFRGIGIKRGAPDNVVKSLISAIEYACTTPDFIEKTESAGIAPLAIFGEEAEALTEAATKYACWSLFDSGNAAQDPATVGLTR